MFIIPTDSRVTLTVAGLDASADQPPDAIRSSGRYRDTSRPETRQIRGTTGQFREEIVSARLLLKKIRHGERQVQGAQGSGLTGKRMGELVRRFAAQEVHQATARLIVDF